MYTEKNILPDILPLIENMPAPDLDDPKGPNVIPNVQLDLSDDIIMTERAITGSRGRQIGFQCFEPRGASGKALPALIWIHGGGYVMDAAPGDSALCQRISLEAGCRVYSPYYALAPKNPYPAGLTDCYDLLRWIASNAKVLGVDPERIAVSGGSAGGGLTAALCLYARDQGGPEICFQMPLYPMLDCRNVTPSSREITKSAFPHTWNRELNVKAWKMYLGKFGSSDSVPIYASPSLANDLSGLPPAYLMVGQLDMFRDETLDYAKALASAGVPAEVHVYPGCPHAFDFMAESSPVSVYARNEYIRALKNAFEK